MKSIRTKVSLVNSTRWDEAWPPSNLVKFQLWVTSLLQRVPVESLSSAEIEWIVSEDRDGVELSVSAFYLRQETESEKALRESHEAAAIKRLAELARLSKKYPA